MIQPDVRLLRSALRARFDELLAMAGITIDDVRCATVDTYGEPVSKTEFVKELRRLAFCPEVYEALATLKAHGIDLGPIHPNNACSRLGLREALDLANAFFMLDAVDEFRI